MSTTAVRIAGSNACLRTGQVERVYTGMNERPAGPWRDRPVGARDGVARRLLDGDRALHNGPAQDAVGVECRGDGAGPVVLTTDRQRVARAIARDGVAGRDSKVAGREERRDVALAELVLGADQEVLAGRIGLGARVRERDVLRVTDADPHLEGPEAGRAEHVDPVLDDEPAVHA